MSAAAAKRTVLAAASILALVALTVLVPVGGASSARRDSEPPTTPRNLRVAGVTQSLVRLAWDPSTDNVAVEGYYVFGDKGKATLDVLDDQGKPILDDDGKPVGDAPGFTVDWLGCGESTELTVIAFDAAQNRSGKATVTVSTAACGDLQPPTAPSAFTQVATSTDSVVLAWAASTDNVGVVEYGVNRNLQRVATPTQPTVTLTGLSCGSTYEYAVDAADAAGNRSPLAQAFVQTAPCPSATDTISPSTPTGLAASNITQTALALNWNASSDNVAVTGYDVYRNGTKVASVTSTSASQSGLSCATSYAFAVRARDGAGRTSAAAQLTVSTAACSTTPPTTTDTISPSTPTGLAASNIAQTALALNWNASSDNVGVTGYDVYRNGARVASVTSTSVDQSTLSCGTSYPFAVRALDGAGRTSAAAQLTVSTTACSTTPPPTDTTPPSTPTGLAIASATRTSVSLTWNPATDNIGVAGYRLYVNGALSLTTTQPASTVSNLSCGTTYTFAVDALDAAGNNSPQASLTGASASCADTQAPSAPTNVVASSRTATSIALSWSASSDAVGVAGYGLYRGGVEVGSTPTTTGIFAGLTCNTNYTLAVDAYDAAGNRSAKTALMVSTTACPDTTPPTVPSGLAASNISQSGLTLTWNASSDNVAVTGYDVYRNGTKMASMTATSASQSGLACGTSYAFGVVARDAAGNSSAQAVLQASTTACPTPTQQLPATITAGGTYSGTRTGTLSIRTADPVVIENSTITNTGTGFVIDANFVGVQLTVRRTTINGGTGQAIYAASYRSITVEQSTINKTWGIRLDRAQSGATVRLTRNKFLNQTFDQATNGNGFWLAHSVQIADSGANHASCEIDWNQFVNEFGQSWVEDVISIYKSSGCRIHDNGIRGAYPTAVSTGYTGGGIMVGDGGGSNNVVENNIIVGTLNYCLGITGGQNNVIRNNRAINDSRSDSGQAFTAQSSGGLGIQVWNINNEAGFANNVASGNTVGVVRADGSRNDVWLGTSGNGNAIAGTTLISSVNSVQEQAEYQGWLSKLAANGMSVGA